MVTFRRALLAAALAAASAVACGGNTESEVASGEAAASARPILQGEADSIFDVVNDACSGKSRGYSTTFESTELSRATDELLAADTKMAGTKCEGQRVSSQTQEDAVKMFTDFVTAKEHKAKACIARNLPDDKVERLQKMVTDPTNRGVFASVYQGGGDDEACDYWLFDVYRKGGDLYRFTFDYRD